jgi:RNA polymerase sigma-70 factor, ECF subfamily
MVFKGRIARRRIFRRLQQQIQEVLHMDIRKNDNPGGNRRELFAEVESHRSYMLRFATAKLRDSDRAEEVVQEALLAALEGVGGFTGNSTLRTWLTSILKFKIVDFQRRAIGERVHFAEVPQDEGDEQPEWLDKMYDETGHWRPRLSAWANPDGALEQKQFFVVFEQCMDKLPTATARVFFKREVMGLETSEICKEESISASNCWVILHRARMSLRECLDRNWFQGKK